MLALSLSTKHSNTNTSYFDEYEYKTTMKYSNMNNYFSIPKHFVV